MMDRLLPAAFAFDELAPVFDSCFGVSVPSSVVEPWISRQSNLLAAMESLDRIFARPLAIMGDHVLYSFRRNAIPES